MTKPETTPDNRHEIDVLNQELRDVPEGDRDGFWQAMWKRDQAAGRERDRQAAEHTDALRAEGYNDKQLTTALAALRECLKAEAHSTPHRYEFKFVNAKVYETGTAWLAVCVGMRGDEGTAAYLFRKTFYFTLGRSGGLTLTNGKGKRGRVVKGLRNIASARLTY